MHNLTKLCLKKPVSTVIIIVAMVIFTIMSISSMNMQLTPDMEMPYIIVFTVYPGAGPDEVDRLVSQELEDVGATIEGLDTIQSRSMENQSIMIYGFKYGTDVDKAFNDLQQEISRATMNIPEECMAPVLVVMDINSMASMNLSVTSKTGAEVRSFVENVMDDEISALPNVAQTNISGGQEDYISIKVNPEMLAQYGMDTSGIISSIKAADFSVPSGEIKVGSQNLNVNAAVDYDNLFDLENIPLLTGSGKSVMLSDVAEVSYAKKKADSISYYNSQDTVGYSITKNQGSNAVALSKDVKEIIEEYKEKHPDISIEVTYDAAERIKSALSSVGSTLVLGVVLSMLVLFIFFGDIKASLIVGSSMPVSLLVTILMMKASGFSLNVITLGAMVIGIGMMVDNSIVVLEMCFQKKDQGFSFQEAAYDAVKTVATSIFASTLTTVVVYLPLAMMKGLSGQMFGPLGFTIIYSLTASLISAVTLVPLCFAKYHPIENKGFVVSKFVRKMADKYSYSIGKVLKRKKTVILATAGMIVLTGVIASFLNVELMARGDEGIVSVTANVRPGLSLEKKDVMIKEIEAIVKADPDVESYSSSASDTTSTITVQANMIDKQSRPTAEIADDWNRKMKDLKDMDIVCESASSSSSQMSSGGKEIAVQGASMDDLRVAVDRITEAIRNVDGVINISSSFSDASAKAEIRIDPVKAMGRGVVPAQAGAALRSIKTGTDVMDLTINDSTYDVTVEYPSERYENIDQLMAVQIKSNFGSMVPLSEIADVIYTDSPQMIHRTGGRYQVSVTATTDSEKKFAAEKEIDAIVSKVSLPANVHMAESSQAKVMREEFTSIITAVLVAMWLVFMVMTMQFESARYALMIMFCIPFSLIGSVLLLFVSNSTLSMTSLMGFLMLEGIVVNNGILMVDTTNQFMESMGLELALVEAGKSRLRPILMTTLTTILSMLPLALGIGKNTESMQGMAVVIVGGLIASTVLTLYLLPTIYLIIAKRKKDKNKKLFGFFGKKKIIAERVENGDFRDEGVDN